MGTIHVEYTRTIGEVGTYSSRRLRGSVELSVPDDADWESAWREVSHKIQAQVDESVGQAQPKDEHAQPDDAERGESSRPESTDADQTDEVSQSTQTIVPNEPVAYAGCRVMFAPEHKPKTSTKKEHLRVRIGNPKIPGQYVTAKSFDAEVMAVLKHFRKGDIVNIEGHFDNPWTTTNTETGQDEERYDLIVEKVERVA